MQGKRHINFKGGARRGLRHRLDSRSLYVFTLLMMIFAGAVISTNDANAADAVSCEDESASCVQVDFGSPVGSQSVEPGLAYYDSTQFYLPVTIGLKNTSVYTIKVYGSGSDLTGDTVNIPTINSDMSYSDLKQSKDSAWGIRWNLGDTVEDKDASYHKVPGSADDPSAVVIQNAQLTKSAGLITKHLTLGFAVSVGADQPSGAYTNTVTVAVVASPRDARSIFDISKMQEMTPEICENTTTPSKDAKTTNAKFDTNAEHVNDPSYIPETTLIDTRDNKSYLVRKLADGNCWMSQNLSLILTATGAANGELTSENTDLNSQSSWAPGTATQTGTGTAWGQNDNAIHSSSSGWDQYWTGATTGTNFTATGNTAQGGQVGYAQRGVYYNWFAATAGSGKSTDKSTTTTQVNAPDSICPKGWMLPTGTDTTNSLNTTVNSTDGSVKSFYNLVQLYTGTTGNIQNTNVNKLYESPMHFVPAGTYNYSTGALDSVGERQLYWSSTAYTTETDAWDLIFYSGTVYPGTHGNNKGYGFSVRCVAR